MSKLNKQQIAHLTTSMNESLRNSIALKFPEVKVTHDEVKAEVKRILEILGLPTTTSTYYLTNFARSLLTTPSTNREERVAYHTKQHTKIAEVLDAAILGEESDALKALKDFKAGL